MCASSQSATWVFMDAAPTSHETLPRLLNVRGSNRLLTLLPKSDLDRLLARMERVPLHRSESVQPAGKAIAYVYFPTEGLVSMVIHMEDGRASEVGTIGNEGMTGLPLLLDAQQSTTEGLIQIPGEALRMSAETFQQEIGNGGAFTTIVRRYAQAFLSRVSQSTACNGLHPVEQRLCRWILMTHERVGFDRLPLTQEFLSVMLGVQR